MSICTVRKGFFTLRDCGEPAMAVCSSCGRPCCALHLRPHDAETVCVECSFQGQDESDDDYACSDYDGSWAIGYRHHYYRTSHYSPFYEGSSPDPAYDRYDVRSFDTESDDSDFDGDGAEGSFADS